jgi:hypothetical protein
VQQTLDVTGLDPNDADAFGPLANVTVMLDDGSRQVTDSSGNYTFADVVPGRRQVTILPPANFVGATAQSLSSTISVGDADVAGINFALTGRNDAIMQNLYELVLQRSPTFDELTAGASRLQAGQTVAAEFGRVLRSQEFGQKVQPVAGFVRAMLPGVLDIGSVRGSVQQQNLGIRQDATIQGIMTSQKFVAANGDTSQLSNPAYVQFLYRRLLNRAPTSAQLNTAVAKLGGGATRGQLALELVATQAFQNRVQLQRSYRGAVTYVGVLGRQGSAAEIQSFTVARTTAVQLAGRLATSAEFRNLDGFTSTGYWDVMAFSLAPPAQPLSRLQQFNPNTGAFDLPVAAGSITSTAAAPRNVYFVAHGWAPGQSQAVLLGSNPGDPLKSWAATPPVPPWLFDPTNQVSSSGLAQAIVDADPLAVVIAYSWFDLSATPESAPEMQVSLTASGSDKNLTVGDTSQLSAGMTVTGAGIPAGTTILRIVSRTEIAINNSLPQPIANVPVVFKGIALDALLRSILYVGQSESRTEWSGQMLAAAIEDALAPDFFGSGQGLLHLIGHSHGAKVATVAAVMLESADVPVSQLTLFDSPEMGPTKVTVPPIPFPLGPLGLAGLGGGQNFVWRFLQELPEISRTPVRAGRQATGGTFVENYYSVSGFGSAVGGHEGLGRVVDVSLRPATLYDPSGKQALAAVLPSHQYPAGWYAQASLQTPSGPANTQNGLSWSPLLDQNAASLLADSYDQFPQSGTATSGEFVRRQFELVGGGPTPAASVVTDLFQYGLQATVGNVADTGTSMTLGVGGDTPLSMATVVFVPFATADSKPIGTGLELDVQFSGVDPGETVQLVVSVHGNAAPQALGGLFTLGGTTGLMTIPLLTLDGGMAGTGRTMATVSLDGFSNSNVVMGPFANQANGVPTLVFSLIASPGAAASVTVSGMRQFGTLTSVPG